MLYHVKIVNTVAMASIIIEYLVKLASVKTGVVDIDIHIQKMSMCD